MTPRKRVMATRNVRDAARCGSARRRVLALGFPPGELERLSSLASGLEILAAGSVDQVQASTGNLARKRPDPVLVSTAGKASTEALVACLQLRDLAPLRSVPLLAAVSLQQEQLGRQVRHIKDSDYIYQPIGAPQLQEKLEALNVGAPAAAPGADLRGRGAPG